MKGYDVGNLVLHSLHLCFTYMYSSKTKHTKLFFVLVLNANYIYAGADEVIVTGKSKRWILGGKGQSRITQFAVLMYRGASVDGNTINKIVFSCFKNFLILILLAYL